MQMMIRRTVIAAILAAACCARASAATPQTFIGASGLYGLIGHDVAPTNNNVANFLAHPQFAGISIRTGWWFVEPTEDNYNWSYIDAMIARAQQYNKKIMIRLRPNWKTPDWVFDAGAEPFWYYERNDNDNLNRMPVPWDPIYQEKWTDFVQAFGARYDNHPGVVHVLVTGVSRSDCEMYLPSNSDRDASQQGTWESIGYTPQKLIDSWKWAIDTYAAAFPNTFISLSLSSSLYNDGVTQAVAQYGAQTYPWRLGFKISFWGDSNDPNYYPVATLQSYVDEFTHGGLEPVSPNFGDTEAGVLNGISWHCVLWNEPYPGQREQLTTMYNEMQKHKAMVSSTTFDAADSQDRRSQLTWTNPSGYAGFQEVKILRKVSGFPAGPNDAAATVVYQGAAQAFEDTGLINGETYHYAMFELPSGYTIAQDIGAPNDLAPPGPVEDFAATPSN